MVEWCLQLTAKVVDDSTCETECTGLDLKIVHRRFESWWEPARCAERIRLKGEQCALLGFGRRLARAWMILTMELGTKSARMNCIGEVCDK